ncbi:MAG TPA: LysM peptidoglycan-binding domain-containing protein [Actinomycetota bacterium]|nr:LysM peptidoglycan-binding domain-containing protein [Actinomycetota bacterium]
MDRTDVRRRGRTRLAVILTVSLAGAAWAGPVARALGGGPEQQPVTRSTYVVRAGDTLWSIAERLSPGQDPRPVVDALTAVNSLEPGALVPGQAILVPAGV